MPLPDAVRDTLVFFKESVHDFVNVGSVLPTSRYLAHETAHLLAKERGPWDILEVGPGTGPITEAILQRMRPEDTLTLYELNEGFVRVLEEKLLRAEAFAPLRERISIHAKPAQAIPPDARYDYIVMGIPLNNLEPGTVAEIMYKMVGVLKAGGTFCYYEYALNSVRRTMFSGEKLLKHLHLQSVLRQVHKRYEYKRERVMLNLPPLHVHYLHNRVV